MKFLSRLKLSQIIIFAAVLLVSAAGIALAQEAPKINPYWREDPTSQVKTVEGGNENEMSAPRYAFFQVNTTFNAIGAGILDPTGQNQQAAVPLLGRSIAMLAGRPPIQTKEYLAYMAGKAGFIDQAYAQSMGGFEVLQPIQKLWIATRNVAYLIVSLTLIVAGFMIMLRKKIDAQTVVGIEQALPNLVITLLLITFSYAIAGFVIDMIYFVIYFAIKLLALPGSSIFGDSAGSNAISTIQDSNLFNIGLASIFGIHGGTQGGMVSTAADAVGALTADLLSTTIIGTTGGQITGLLSQPIAFVIFAVALLFAIFKLFFSLLMAYIQIILLAILGPLQLMFNALPGSDAFSKWFRNLLANAMAFPAAALMLVFAAALTSQSGTGLDPKTNPWDINPEVGFMGQNIPGGVGWIPPLIFGTGGNVSGTGVGGSTSPVNAVMALFGMGILLMTPKVVDMVKEAIQAPEFKYGSAIGEAVGAGWGGTKGVVGGGIGRGEGYFRGERAERTREAGFLAEERFREAAGGTDAKGNLNYTGRRYQAERGRLGRFVDVLRGK